MALQVNSDAQLVFFKQVFGAAHTVTLKAKALIAAGVKFEVTLYAIRAQHTNGDSSQVQLTVGSTSLMKQSVAPGVFGQNIKLIEGWIDGVYVTAGHPQHAAEVLYTVTLKGQTSGHVLALTKAVFKAKAGELTLGISNDIVKQAIAGTPALIGVYQTVETAKLVAEALKAAGGDVEVASVPKSSVAIPVAAVKTWAAAKPVPSVIQLRDAQALGQQVHGTSTGSVYYTIALTEHVKVAARLYKGGSISIRAEWTDSPKADLQKLEESGVQMKSNYGSIHFDSADVPVQRVIGAFLVGTGIQWKAAVMNGAELVIQESK